MTSSRLYKRKLGKGFNMLFNVKVKRHGQTKTYAVNGPSSFYALSEVMEYYSHSASQGEVTITVSPVRKKDSHVTTEG
jgi:hypothetical protein